MASHEQSYRAGKAEGRARVVYYYSHSFNIVCLVNFHWQKLEFWGEQMKDKAEAAKHKTFEATQEAKDKTYQTGQAAKESAESAKEKTGGILQQTGETVMNKAQGAAVAVKHTFGMADADEDEDNYPSRRDTSNY
ncbi:hypothetical protein POUND7_003597 [Theobroma cacao]